MLTFDTKKRRILLIVVSRYQSVFQRLMLLDYQIRLDLASRVVLMDIGEWVIRWVFVRKMEHSGQSVSSLYGYRTSSAFCKCVILSIVHKAFLCGRAWQPAPTQKFEANRNLN